MNELDIIRKLAVAAKGETIPEVSVTRAVIAAINANTEQSDRPLMWIAGLSSLAALAACVLAVQAFETWPDPSAIPLFAIAGLVTL
jgi:hypothetical protein